MIERLKACLPVWKGLIDISFLPRKMKADYGALLEERVSRL